jgi:hypothetical protein
MDKAEVKELAEEIETSKHVKEMGRVLAEELAEEELITEPLAIKKSK